MRAAVLVMLLASGCGSETTALLDIKPASQLPLSLRLTMWGEGVLRPPADLPLGARTLPGTLIVRGLDPRTPDFRVLVQGLDSAGVVQSEAGAHVPLTGGEQSLVTVQLLDGNLADSDGDDVPDVVDDCPSVPDEDQRCAAPNRDLASVTVVDLAAPDLAGADLAGPPPDLSTPDLLAGDLARGPACPAFALFCDDFESGDFSKWDAPYTEGGSSTVKVEAQGAWSGNWAALAVGSGGVTYRPKTFGPFTSGMVAFRAYFFAPTTLVPHIYFFWLHRAGTGDADYNIGFDNFSGPGRWTVFNKNTGNAYDMVGSTAPGVWHCIEVDVTLDGATDVVDFYLDGAGPQTTNITTGAATSLGELSIGVTYQTVSTANTWLIDDVVIATQHIGCE
jgi:hypothetical protein